MLSTKLTKRKKEKRNIYIYNEMGGMEKEKLYVAAAYM